MKNHFKNFEKMDKKIKTNKSNLPRDF